MTGGRRLMRAWAGTSTAASIVTIGYVWIGYPVLIDLVARRRPVPGRPDPDWSLPTVSVVVAALDEEQVIGPKVAELLASAYPAELLDVIVVADGSVDRTAEAALEAGGSRVQVVADGARGGKCAAVNRGVAAARGEIVVLSDANNHYEPETIARLVAPFADADIGATIGAKRVSGGADEVAVADGAYWRYESAIKAAESRGGSCTAASGEVMALRRTAVVELPTSVVNDDFFMMLGVLRGGQRVVYVPDARSVEQSSATREDEQARRTRMAAGRFDALSAGWGLLPSSRRLRWQIISHKYLRLALPWAFLWGIAGSVIWVGAGGRRTARVLCVGQVAFQGVSLAARRVRPAGPLGKALSVPAYLLDVNVATARGLVAWRRGTYRSGWDRVRRAGEGEGPVEETEGVAA